MMHLFDLFICAIEVILLVWFFNKQSNKKKSTNLLYYGFLASIIFLSWGLTVIDFALNLKPLILCILQAIFVFLYYEDKLIKKICLIVTFEAILIASDLISVAIFIGIFRESYVIASTNSFFIIYGSILSKIILFIVILIINLFNYNKMESIPIKFWMAFLLFPFISIFIVMLLLENEIALGRYVMSSFITVASIGLLIMNLSMIFLMEKLAQNIKYNSILNIEKQRLSYQQDYYDLLFSKQQEIRTLWHDLKHHFVVIGGFAKENQNEKILDYLSEINEDIVEADNVVRTGNFIIDSIINQKYQYALKNDIRISVNSNLSQKLNIDSNDLCIVIANALDNSIEAVKNIKSANPEDKIVKVNVETKNDNFIFTVINKFNEIKLGKDNKPVTTKKDYLSHGLGLKSIEKTALNYKGNMDIEIENKTFILSVIMKI